MTPYMGGFTEFVAARSTSLLRTAYLTCGSLGEAEDVLQTALERACMRWEKLCRAGDPEPYIRRIIVNLAISRARRLAIVRFIPTHTPPDFPAAHVDIELRLVSVYRTEEMMRDGMDILSLNVFRSPVEPRRSSDPVLSDDGTASMWVADHRLLLKVTVSAGLKGERDRIAGGLRVTGWDSAFAGLGITYMPAGMWVAGTADTYGAALNRLWQGDSGRRVLVEVVYGRDAATLDKLRAAVPPEEPLTEVRPASVHDLPAYAGATGQAGRVMLWLVKPGIGIRVRADHLPESELKRIAEGIQAVPDGRSQSVDGIGVSFDDPKLRPGPVRTALATGWRTTSRRWTGRNGDDTVTVSVQRGAGVSSQGWWASLSSGEAKPTTIAGLSGNLLDPGASTTTRTFVWTPEFGLAVVVTAPERDLRRIVKGIAVP